MHDRPSQEAIEEGYKQVRLNTRAAAIDRAMQARAYKGVPEEYTVDQLIADAKKIEEYMLHDITPPQASNILRVHGAN